MQKSSTHKKNENIDLFVGLDVHKEVVVQVREVQYTPAHGY